VKLHDRLITVVLDNKENDRLDGEEPTLFHILKMEKRRTARTTQSVQDAHGNTHESPKSIVQAFANYLRKKYEPIAIDARCIEAMVEAAQPDSPITYEEQPITPEEMTATLRKGGRNKAPASDGIGLEFYKTNWATI
jgi:hypothetical protein